MALGTTFKLGFDATSVQRGLSKLKGRMASIGKGIAGAFSSIAKATAALFAAAAAGALVYFNKFRKEMDRIGKLATRFNLPAEQIQRLGVLAELGGTSLEKLQAAMTKAKVGGVEAANGIKTYSDAFKSLGIDVDKFNQMDPSDQLLELARGWKRAKSEADGFHGIYRILGRAGADLIPTLRAGPERMEKSMGNLKVVSEDVVRKMEMFNDTLTVISANVRAAFGEAIQGLMPTLETLMPKLEKSVGKWFRKVAVAVNAALSGNSDAIVAAFDVVWRKVAAGLIAIIMKAATEIGTKLVPLILRNAVEYKGPGSDSWVGKLFNAIPQRQIAKRGADWLADSMEKQGEGYGMADMYKLAEDMTGVKEAAERSAEAQEAAYQLMVDQAWERRHETGGYTRPVRP